MQIRPATLEDSGHFARVFEVASFGLAPYFWRQKAGPEGDPHQVALASMRDKLVNAAPNTALVADRDGQVAGGIMTYAIGSEPDACPPGCDPVIASLIELENKALNTHYINAIAVFPEFQGQGIGTALLRRVLRNAGPDGMSLIAEDQNLPARALYKREGFVDVATVPIVKGGWQTVSNAFVLMKRAPR